MFTKHSVPTLPDVEHKYISIDGIKLHIAEAGMGKPLLLLHGWPQHWYIWRKVIPLLKDEFRLIMPDLPGFGWSDIPEDNDFRKEKLAKDIIRLLDTLQLKQVGLIGHDWGGWIGFLSCLEESKKFRSYLALSIGYPLDTSNAWISQSWRFSYQLPIATPFLGETLLRYLPSLTEWGIKKCAYKNIWTKEDLLVYSLVFKDAKKAKASSLLYRSFLTQEVVPLLLGKYKNRKYSLPTHLLIGKNDPIISPTLFKGFKDTNTIQVRFIENCGHFIPEEKPDIVAEEIKILFK